MVYGFWGSETQTQSLAKVMGGRLELVSSQAHTLNNPVYFLNCNIPANPINPPHSLLLVPSLNSLFESLRTNPKIPLIIPRIVILII